MKDTRYNQLYILFQHMTHQLHRLELGEMEEVDMQPGQAAVLRLLRRMDGATQKELADFMVVRPASMTHLLQKLEEQDLVERRPNPDDRRSTNVFLTEVGTKKAIELEEHRDLYTEKMFSILSIEQQDELIHMLTTLETEWERTNQQHIDALPAFLYLTYVLSPEELSELLDQEGIEVEPIMTILNDFHAQQPPVDDVLDDHRDNFECYGWHSRRRQGGPSRRAGGHPSEGASGRQGRPRTHDGHGPHGHHGTHDEGGSHGHHGAHGSHGAAMDKGRGRMHGPGLHGHPAFGEGGRSHGKHRGRRGGHPGGREQMHRMRRQIVRTGFNFEGLRLALEEEGLGEEQIQRLLQRAADME